MNDITPKEAIANLNHLYGMVAPDIQRSLDVAIKALERPQGDCISREAINSEIEKRYCSKHCVVPSEEPYCPDICPARFLKDIVKECPPTPERPQGEWLFKHNSSDIWCSVCDENFNEIPQAFNFCPNCGADMRPKGGKE